MGDDFFLQLKQEPGCADIPVVIASVLPAESCGKLLQLDTGRDPSLERPTI